MPNETTEPKSPRFSIKKYSIKTQRKYARLLRANSPHVTTETLIKRFRYALIHKKSVLGIFGRTAALQQKQALGSFTPANQNKVHALREQLSRCYQSGMITIPPTPHNDWVGVEFEFYFDNNKLRNETNKVEKSNSLQEYLKYKRIKYYSVTGDGSLRSPENTSSRVHHVAIETPILDRVGTGLQNIKNFCAAIKPLSPKVNAKCGLHVHLDCRHLTAPQVEHLANKFVRALPLLLAMQHPIRRENTFALPTRNFTNSVDYNGKYYAVNVNPYYQTDSKKTVEIRIHSGTTNFLKVANWCELLQAIKETDFIGEITTPIEAAHKLPTLSAANLSYIEARVAHFEGGFAAIASREAQLIETADTDAEEARLGHLVNYPLLEQLYRAATSKTLTKEQIMAAYESMAENESLISEQLGSDRMLVFFEMLSSQLKKRCRDLGIPVTRNNFSALYRAIAALERCRSLDEVLQVKETFNHIARESHTEAIWNHEIRKKSMMFTRSTEGTINFSEYLLKRPQDKDPQYLNYSVTESVNIPNSWIPTMQPPTGRQPVELTEEMSDEWNLNTGGTT